MTDDVKSAIETINWLSYENTVLTNFEEAIKKYNAIYASDSTEKVAQVSLWTDPQAAVTSVSFDTHENFVLLKQYQVNRYRNKNRDDLAAKINSLQFQGNPAEFKYADFCLVNNPELKYLSDFITDTGQGSTQALAQINTNLLNVVNIIVDQKLLATLHSETEVLVGINSPDDWYDCIRTIQCN